MTPLKKSHFLGAPMKQALLWKMKMNNPCFWSHFWSQLKNHQVSEQSCRNMKQYANCFWLAGNHFWVVYFVAKVRTYELMGLELMLSLRSMEGEFYIANLNYQCNFQRELDKLSFESIIWNKPANRSKYSIVNHEIHTASTIANFGLSMAFPLESLWATEGKVFIVIPAVDRTTNEMEMMLTI